MWYKLFSGARWWLGAQCDLQTVRLGVSLAVWKGSFWGHVALGPFFVEFGRDRG